ncbi:type II toxin-antitoxin system antitoxin DNA ADP-ribosyl glycohydrolase DarG [Salinisphaera hydrothermalis]|uniref:type II toxin-antitoxin system antitoxin DNA ADP-ribosyl glycohydrolase DarG n=1 Tax=Salinisphaera hydrothermalis TaxID=563188 RepID=UPI0033412CFA
MINYTSGNVLACEADALVNTVNCVGVMGRGIALQFKKAWPDNFKAYAAACKRNELQPGRMFVYETGQLAPPRFLINFPTKRHWREKSRIQDIDAGLIDLIKVIRERQIRSIAVPPLGSGLGGLDWSAVRSRIDQALADLPDVQIYVFEPTGAPASHNMAHEQKRPNMTPGRAALVELMQRYLGGLLDPFVSLLELHKLMYFMQEAGEPLRLDFRKHYYGPYASNLRHVLNRIEGHFIEGYADGGDDPSKPLALRPGAAEQAGRFLDRHAASRNCYDRVTRLAEGFESPDGLELLATVHWVVKQDGITDPDEVIQMVRDWSVRKQRFTPRQIDIARERLQTQGWLLPQARVSSN